MFASSLQDAGSCHKRRKAQDFRWMWVREDTLIFCFDKDLRYVANDEEGKDDRSIGSKRVTLAPRIKYIYVLDFVHSEMYVSLSVFGLMVRIAAFQAAGSGSIPEGRSK